VTSDGPVPVKATVSEGTEYVILKQTGQGDWSDGVTTTARSADQAVRETVSKLAESEQSGTYVAIPARSFKPVTVVKQTVTTLKIEEAK